MTGFTSIYGNIDSRCLFKKFETPIDLTKPAFYISTIAFHVANLPGSPGCSRDVGQCMSTKSRYSTPNY